MKNDKVILNKVEVLCVSCNSTFKTMSTKESLKVDSCNNCHPYYIGSDSSASKAGRAERFNQKFGRK